MVAEVVQLFVQFPEGHVAGVARNPKVDGVDPVAEAVFYCLFFGTATQREAARRRRARGAVREQEDEDAQGHDGQQATRGGCPGPGQQSLFVRLRQSKLVIGHRAGCAGLIHETGVRPRAARAARGRMGSLRRGR